MIPTLGHGLIFFFCCIGILLVEAFFSGSELALLSADRLELKRRAQNGSQSATRVLELLNTPERILSTTLLITCLCVVTLSALMTIVCTALFGENSEWIAVIATSPLVVCFGELLPKTYFQRNATDIAPKVVLPVRIAFFLFYPLTRTLCNYTSSLSKILGPIEELLAGKKKDARAEIQQLLSYGKRESEIRNNEKKMIKRILDFKDSEAKHALIPLVQVDAVEENSNVKQTLENFEKHRHSRMPVYSGRIDNIVGVLEISDLFAASDLTQSIKHYVSSAHYVAETQSLEDLLSEMHEESLEMVVVVDEHGGAIGIITYEDIFEEIVGDIQDEYDSEGSLFKQSDDKTWIIQSKIEIPALNESLKFRLPEGDYETLGGFLLQQFGRIPETGDELYFDVSKGTIKFTVKKATPRRIESIEAEWVSQVSDSQSAEPESE